MNYIDRGFVFIGFFIIPIVSPGAEVALFDLTGSWSRTFQEQSDCPGGNADESSQFAIVQAGSTILVIPPLGQDGSGTITGSTLQFPLQSWSDNYFFGDGWRTGTTTETSKSVAILSDSLITATVNWLWTDGSYSCSGTASWTAVKTSAPSTESEVAPVQVESPQGNVRIATPLGQTGAAGAVPEGATVWSGPGSSVKLVRDDGYVQMGPGTIVTILPRRTENGVTVESFYLLRGIINVGQGQQVGNEVNADSVDPNWDRQLPPIVGDTSPPEPGGDLPPSGGLAIAQKGLDVRKPGGRRAPGVLPGAPGGGGKRFEILTPVATLSLTDAACDLEYSSRGNEGLATVTVTFGELQVVSTGESSEGTSTVVSAGESYTVEAALDRSSWIQPAPGAYVYGGVMNNISWTAFEGAAGYLLEYTFPQPSFGTENAVAPEFAGNTLLFPRGTHEVEAGVVVLPVKLPALVDTAVEARIFAVDSDGNVLPESVSSNRLKVRFK